MDATCLEDVGNPIGVQKDVVIVDDNIKEPYVGMIFSSLEEAKSFYEDYGRHKGFATRIRSTYRDRHGPEISSALLVCTCEGFNRKNPTNVDEATPTTKRTGTILRSGCKASLRVTNIRGTSVWKVTNFSDHHNHNLFIQSKGFLLKYSGRKPHAGKSPTESQRFNAVCHQATRLAYMAGKSEEIYEVIMAVMEETFKKASEMEKELFNNSNDETAPNDASENPSSPGSSSFETMELTNQAIPLHPHTSEMEETFKNENGEPTPNVAYANLNTPGGNSFEMMKSVNETIILQPFTSEPKRKKRIRTGKEKVISGTDMYQGHSNDSYNYQHRKRPRPRPRPRPSDNEADIVLAS